MGFTLTQLQTKVRLRLQATTDDAVVTTAQLTESINNGLRNFALERDWPWLVTSTTITTAADDGTYDLPADFIHAKGLSIDGGYPLEEVSLNELLRYQRQSGTTQPAVYYHDGVAIRFGPVPTSVLTIDLIYVRGESELSGDSDTIRTPNQYADLVVDFAALDAAIVLRDQNLVNSLMKSIETKSGKYSTALQRSSAGPRIDTRTDTWI
jgi:hypothetical protein